MVFVECFVLFKLSKGMHVYFSKRPVCPIYMLAARMMRAILSHYSIAKIFSSPFLIVISVFSLTICLQYQYLIE